MFQVDDIGNLNTRNASKLVSFTTNLNPALRDCLRLLASVPMSDATRSGVDGMLAAKKEEAKQSGSAVYKTAFENRREFATNQEQKPEQPKRGSFLGTHVRLICKPEDEPAPPPPAVDEQKDENNEKPDENSDGLVDENSDELVDAKGSLKDDRTGVDHIGSSEYALHIAQLIDAGLEAPSVIGICECFSLLAVVWGGVI